MPRMAKRQCPTCHGHFLADEIVEHADLCVESAHRVSFLWLTETPPVDDIPDEVASMAETSKASSNVLPLSDVLSPLVYMVVSLTANASLQLQHVILNFAYQCNGALKDGFVFGFV